MGPREKNDSRWRISRGGRARRVSCQFRSFFTSFCFLLSLRLRREHARHEERSSGREARTD